MSPGTGTVRECRSHLAGAAFQKLSREGQGSSRAQCWGWTGAQNQRDKGPVGVRAPSPPPGRWFPTTPFRVWGVSGR